MALYGIAREAATNIVRHAGARSATMRLFTGPSGACLTVEDDGRGAAAETDGHGHGIAGMAERVGLLGGSFSAGPRPRGGFRVEARIPLGAEKEAS